MDQQETPIDVAIAAEAAEGVLKALHEVLDLAAKPAEVGYMERLEELLAYSFDTLRKVTDFTDRTNDMTGYSRDAVRVLIGECVDRLAEFSVKAGLHLTRGDALGRDPRRVFVCVGVTVNRTLGEVRRTMENTRHLSDLGIALAAAEHDA